jgi:guanosine-3',5'-bis(diphosphate) 3'-pyrophosphohydrolase
MNEMADNLEHLCYQNLDLDMFNDVQTALLETKPKRCEYQAVWEQKLSDLLKNIIYKVVLKRKIIISNYYVIL